MANKVYEFEDFEMVDDWHYDAPIVGWKLKGTDKIFDIGEMRDIIKSSGGRWGYFRGGLASLYNKYF